MNFTMPNNLQIPSLNKATIGLIYHKFLQLVDDIPLKEAQAGCIMNVMSDHSPDGLNFTSFEEFENGVPSSAVVLHVMLNVYKSSSAEGIYSIILESNVPKDAPINSRIAISGNNTAWVEAISGKLNEFFLSLTPSSPPIPIETASDQPKSQAKPFSWKFIFIVGLFALLVTGFLYYFRLI